MFNTMTLAKYGGALCGALLAFLLLNWAGNAIYGTGAENAAKDTNPGYVVAVAEKKAPPAATPAKVVVLVGDATKGEKVFRKCQVCHSDKDGVNGIGPSLYNVVGRKTASEAGYSYSKALQGLGGDWTPARLDKWLTKPSAFAPGTKMGFAGLKKPADRANIIAFLESFSPAWKKTAPAKKAAAPAPAPAPAKKATAAVVVAAAGDAAKGKQIFRECQACHSDKAGVNKFGPSLYNVVGRKVATEAGYTYSKALQGLGGDWTPARLDKWLTKPSAFAPGTKMGFAGLKKPADRTNMIAFLESVSPAWKKAAPAKKSAVPATAPVKKSAAPAAVTVALAGNAANGKKIFRECQACHSDKAGVNKFGPSLYGVVGRKVATEAGYTYSKALQGLGGDWTPARLDKWLTKPSAFAPGTKMGFAGLKKPAQRADIIAFLDATSK